MYSIKIKRLHNIYTSTFWQLWVWRKSNYTWSSYVRLFDPRIFLINLRHSILRGGSLSSFLYCDIRSCTNFAVFSWVFSSFIDIRRGGGGGEGVLILRATSILKNQGATNALWKNNFPLRMVASFVLVILTWANFLVDQPSLSTFAAIGNSLSTWDFGVKF